MNYTIIALIFIIVLMLYAGYMYITNTSITSGVVSLQGPGTDYAMTKWQKLDDPGATQYHYEGWLFIKTLPGPTVNGTIFQRELSTTKSTGLVLNGSTLTFSKSTGAPLTSLGTIPPNVSTLVTITEDFPIQKWVYFVVNIKDQLIECYLNGKLIKSQMVPTGTATGQADLTPSTRKNLYLGDGSTDGYITKFKREPSVLTPDQVWKRYLQGNGLATFSNWLAGYNASFSLYTTTEEVKKYSLL